MLKSIKKYINDSPIIIGILISTNPSIGKINNTKVIIMKTKLLIFNFMKLINV